MEENEMVLVSQSTTGDSLRIRIIVSIICLVFFIILYYNAIIQQSWLIAITSAILPCGAILIYSSSLRNKFYFSEKKIIMADEKNEYVDEIETNEILSWNYYAKYIEDTEQFSLIIKTQNKYFVIDRESYSNYYEMVDFFKKRDFKRDVNLEFNSKVQVRTVYSKTEDNVIIKLIVTILIILFIFWLTLQSK